MPESAIADRLPSPRSPPLPTQKVKQPAQHKNKTHPVTPVRADILDQYLEGYTNRHYLIQGFNEGFRLGFVGTRKPTEAPNLKSCSELPNIMSEKLAVELESTRIKGPFNFRPFTNLQVSPIGLVPKKTPGQFRLIHHLSYPQGKSINDYIDPSMASVSYACFDDAVALVLQLGPGALMAKTDIDSAFRIIPIHPSDHELLGFKFGGQYYYDTCLPMGASSSCAIFESFSSALHWIANKKLAIPHMVHILDDFLILGPPRSTSCQRNLNSFLQFCKNTNIPIKSEKTESARTTITFMGLELDSIAMEARLPQDKLNKLRLALAEHAKKRKITLKELQSLLGLLNFCCNVVLPGRCFLRRLTDLTKKVSKPNHRITFNKESRRDLRAWQIFVEHFNGRQLLLPLRWITSSSLHLFTDAAGSLGYGAILRSKWLYGAWPDHLAQHNITFKELFPIVLSFEIWGDALKNRCIQIHSDNAAVVHIINKQSSKDTQIMVLVRRLVLAAMKFNILLKATHIPGKNNVLPDLLSRLQIVQFQSAAGNMDPDPTPIPVRLLNLHPF